MLSISIKEKNQNWLFFLSLLIALLLPIALPTPVSAVTPTKIALLQPVSALQQIAPALPEIFTNRIMHKFRYPYYEIIAQTETNSALAAHIAGKQLATVPDQATLQQLAATLHADIVIVPEIVDIFYEVRYFPSFLDSDPRVSHYVELKCHTYDAANKKLSVFRAVSSGTDNLTIDSNLTDYFRQVTDNLLAQLPWDTIPASPAH